jgi:hypothetical protein
MTTKEIISSFRQGGTGNCVSIAIIKAGIEIFGVGKIFHASPLLGNGYKIVMRDGFELELSANEVKQAEMGSRFIKLDSQEIYEYAVLCFAAMAKRAQLEQNDDFGALTFDQAMQTLNDGEYYLEGPGWMGLRHHYRSIGRKYIFHYPGVIGASRKHCFFASFGIEDDHGSPEPIAGLEGRFCKWVRITSEQVY